VSTLPERPSISGFYGVITVVLTLVGWSSVPLFLRHFAEHIDAWTSNGWRYGFSALLWLPLLLIAGARGRIPKRLFLLAIVPSLVNAGGQICFTWAHYRIDPGLLTFGLRSQLIFVAIGAFALFPVERPVIRHPGYLAGMALLLAGVAGTMAGGEGLRSALQFEGAVLAVTSGMLFAGYGLAVRWYMSRINPVIAFAAICQYTGGAMVVLMLILGDRGGLTALDLSASGMSWLLISAVIGIALGHVFYYISIARLGVAVSAGVLQLQPFLVSVFSMMLFAEQLTRGQWFFGCVAVTGAVGMLIVQRLISRAIIAGARTQVIPIPPRAPGAPGP